MCAVIMLRGMGGDMVLAAAGEQTLETLRRYGVDRMVHTYASVDAAVVAVHGPISVGDAERL
jgi:predicted Fe-Mo cluster-binding NifX family protein